MNRLMRSAAICLQTVTAQHINAGDGGRGGRGATGWASASVTSVLQLVTSVFHTVETKEQMDMFGGVSVTDFLV